MKSRKPGKHKEIHQLQYANTFALSKTYLQTRSIADFLLKPFPSEILKQYALPDQFSVACMYVPMKLV